MTWYSDALRTLNRHDEKRNRIKALKYFNSTLQIPLILSSLCFLHPFGTNRRLAKDHLVIITYRALSILFYQKYWKERSCWLFQHKVKRPYCARSMDVGIIWRGEWNSGYRSLQHPRPGHIAFMREARNHIHKRVRTCLTGV